MALIIRPVPEEIDTSIAILDLFGDASGLRTNYQKSTATLIRCDDVAREVALALPCEFSEFPCKYLGLPLAPTRLQKCHLQSH